MHEIAPEPWSQKRWIAALVLAFMGFGALLAAVTWYSARAVDEHLITFETGERMRSYGVHSRSMLESAAHHHEVSLRAMAESPGFQRFLAGESDPAVLAAECLQTLLWMDEPIQGLRFVGDGHVLSMRRGGEGVEITAPTEADVELYRKLVVGAGADFGALVGGGALVAPLAVPVAYHGAYRGALVADVSWDSWLQMHLQCQSWDVCVVNREGTRIAGTSTARPLRGASAAGGLGLLTRAEADKAVAVEFGTVLRAESPLSLWISPTTATLAHYRGQHTRYITALATTVFFASTALALGMSLVPVRLSARLLQAQAALRDELHIVDEFVYASTTDLDGVIISVTSAFCALSGYPREELIGKTHALVRHPDTPDDTFRDLWATVKRGGEWRATVRNRTKDGRDFWTDTVIRMVRNREGNAVAYTAYRRDITYLKRVEDLSIRDALTGLLNRRRFNEVLPDELARARRDGRVLAFCVADVDDFKGYNDTYGHQAGDAVLAAVGRVLSEKMRRAGDFSFRLGGEEFGVLYGARDAEQALAWAERLRAAVEALAVAHAGSRAAEVVTLSVGVAVVEPAWGIEAAEAYRRADQALYVAKNGGRNRVMVYVPAGES